MTTIAYKAGVVAADSREIESGSIGVCEKLFRKRVAKRDVVIATAGSSYAGMLFVDWFGSGKEPPSALTMLNLEEDFDVLILDRGKVYAANHLCRPVEIITPFHAIGSGRDAALAAMHCGRTAREAVVVACKIDPNSALPVVTMSMPGKNRQ